MRSIAIGVLALLLMVQPAMGVLGATAEATASAKGSAGLVPHKSILIQGDSAFTPENGVRGGSGTPEDPYVISNWTILATEPYAIRLVDTTAHVVIGRIWVPQQPILLSQGIHLVDAGNVTIQDVIVSEAGTGLRTDGTTNHVQIQRSRFGPTGTPSIGDAFTRGLWFDEIEHATVSNVSVAMSFWPLTIDDTDHLSIRDAAFSGDGSFIPVSRVENVSIQRTHIVDAVTFVSVRSANLSLAYNLHQQGRSALELNGLADHRAYTVCGNRFEDTTSGGGAGALDLRSLQGLEVIGNVFEGNPEAAKIFSDDVVFRRNRVVNASIVGLATNADAQVHQNAFVDNALHSLGSFADPQDARLNWWGAPDGPNVTPIDGSGDRVLIGDSEEPVFLDPWLTAPPATGPDAVDCGVPQGPAGVKQTPRLQLPGAGGLP